MVAATSSVTMFLVSSLLCAKNCVIGFKKPCPKAAIFDLTGEEPDSTGSVNKSGYVFPREAMWSEDGKTFGCPCDLKNCLAFCCPPGYAANADGCVRDNLTYHHSLLWKSEILVHLFTEDPCELRFVNFTVLEKRYIVFPHGSINVFNFLQVQYERGLCVLREENSQTHLMGLCIKTDITDMKVWFTVCLNTSTLFAVATFVVYSVIPELKNLQGSIFRCYLATYIACMFLLTMVFAIEIPLDDRKYFRIMIFGVYYLTYACLVWLNVMSFNIWRKFRRFRAVPEINIKKRQDPKFVRYSIFGWLSSAVLPLIMYGCDSLFREVESSLAEYWYVFPFVCIGICNTCMFIATALRIKQIKKDTAHLVGRMNKHHQENEQWFNLYVKLFIIMGGPLIIWAIALCWANHTIFKFILILEALQGISIFVTFVWKDNIKRLLRQRFDEVRFRVSFFFRQPESTPAI